MTMEEALDQLGVCDDLLSDDDRAFLDATGYLPNGVFPFCTWPGTLFSLAVADAGACV